MKASEFKTEIKKIKEILKGITIQFVKGNNVRPIRSLKEFGLQILEEEKHGSDFKINMAWTSEGIINVNTFEQLIQLLRTKIITCVTVEAFYQPKNFAESMRLGFTLND